MRKSRVIILSVISLLVIVIVIAGCSNKETNEVIGPVETEVSNNEPLPNEQENPVNQEMPEYRYKISLVDYEVYVSADNETQTTLEESSFYEYSVIDF